MGSATWKHSKGVVTARGALAMGDMPSGLVLSVIVAKTRWPKYGGMAGENFLFKTFSRELLVSTAAAAAGVACARAAKASKNSRRTKCIFGGARG